MKHAMDPDFDEWLAYVESKALDPPDCDEIPDRDERFFTKADWEYERENDL